MSRQAQAIVDMRLGRLSGLEQEKINDEYKDLESRIAGFEDILSCDANILAVVKKELQEIKQKYGDERHTRIENVADEIDIEDLIEQQDCAYTLTHFGYIKRQPTSSTVRSAAAAAAFPREHPRGGLREGHLHRVHA